MKDTKVNKKISLTFYLIYMSFTLAAAVVPGLLILNLSGNMLKGNILQGNQTITQQTANRIDHYISDTVNELNLISDMIMGAVNDPWVAEVLLNNAAIRSKDFSTLYFSIDEEVPEGHRKIQVNQEEIYISEVWFNEEHIPHITISIEIVGFNKYRYLTGVIDLHNIWNLIDSISIGKTGAGLLLSESLELIAFPEKAEIFISPAFLGSKIDKSKKIFTIQAQDTAGNTQYISLSPVNNTGWFAGIQQSVSEALKPLVETTGQSIAIIGTVIFLFLLLTYFKIKQSVEFYESLTEKEISSPDKNNICKVSQSMKDMTSKIKTAPYRFLTIAENVSIPIIITDQKFVISYVNPELKNILQFPASEILDIPIQYFLTPGSYLRLLKSFEHMEKAGKEFSVLSLEYVRRDKTARTMTFKIRKRSFGDKAEYYFFGDQLTGKENGSQSLREELRVMCGDFTEAEEIFRNQAASEIRETIEKSLIHLRKRITQIDSDEKTDYMDYKKIFKNLERQTDTIIRKTDSLVNQMHSPLADGKSLYDSLEQFLIYLKNETTMFCELSYQINEKDIKDHIKILIYRSALIFVTDSIKKSDASKISLSLKNEQKNLIFLIHDNRTLENMQLDASFRKSPDSLITSLHKRIAAYGGKATFKNTHRGGIEFRIEFSDAIYKKGTAP